MKKPPKRIWRRVCVCGESWCDGAVKVGAKARGQAFEYVRIDAPKPRKAKRGRK